MSTAPVQPLPQKLVNQAFWYLSAIERMRRGMSGTQMKSNRSCRDIRHVVRAIYLSENRRNAREITVEKLLKFVQKRIDPAFRNGKWVPRVELIFAMLQTAGVLTEKTTPRGTVLSLSKDDPLIRACVKGIK